MSNYYDKLYDSEAYSIEQAILAEDTKFSAFQDLDAKFFVKILTPMIDSKELTTRVAKGITSANYITLTIPSYLLIPFMNISLTTIKVPTQMNTETGLPIKYKNYNVLTYGKGAADEDTTKTKKSAKKTTKSTTGTSFVIPKGTIFFIEFLGGQPDADKAFVIGLSPFKFIE